MADRTRARAGVGAAVGALAAVLVVVFAATAPSALGKTPHLAEVLTLTREAIYGPTGVPSDGSIRLHGPARIFDLQLEGEMLFDGAGRFRTEFSGEFTQASGHDGAHTWERSPAGNARRLQDGNANFQRLLNWFFTSHWLAPDAGWTMTAHAQGARRIRISVDAGHGATGEILIDRETWLPLELSTTQFGRARVARVDWGTRIEGRLVPERLELWDDGELNIEWTIDSAEPLTAPPSFEQPRDEVRVVYDASVEPQLRTMKASGGHLWVRPLINGRDMGWFLFDTGANGTVIDARVARELGLPVYGEIDSTGIGGQSTASLRRVESMELAGVRIEDVPIVSRDLSRSDSSMGVDIAGYLGVDLLAHGVIVYNERDVEIAFHVPDLFTLARGAWVDMPIHNGKPAVRMEYEGNTGLFTIDTGAPGRMLIGPQAIERNNLLHGRRTRASRAYGSGGSVAARRGTLDYVVWGGTRFENVPTTFITEDKGAGADVLRDGIVGANLLRRFIVVFDIEGERMAFLDHE